MTLGELKAKILELEESGHNSDTSVQVSCYRCPQERIQGIDEVMFVVEVGSILICSDGGEE